MHTHYNRYICIKKTKEVMIILKDIYNFSSSNVGITVLYIFPFFSHSLSFAWSVTHSFSP